MRITRKDIRLSCGHYLISGVICIRHMSNIFRMTVIRSYFQMACLGHLQLIGCFRVDFITRTVQDIIDFVGENFFENTSQLKELIHKLNIKRGIWLSTRLMQVLIYNQRLVRIVRDYMILKCECVPDRDEQICYCNVWTVEEVKNFNKIYFVDAGRICSNEVFFYHRVPRRVGNCINL